MVKQIFVFIKFCMLSILIVLMTFSYLPTSFSADGEMLGTYSRYIQLLTVGLFGICFLGNIRSVLNSRVIIRYTILLFGFLLFVFGFISVGLLNNYVEIPSLLIVLVTICTGYTLDIPEKYLKLITILYVATMIYVGYQQISVNIGAFVIEDQYLTSAKNSLGPLLAIAGIGALLLAFQDEILEIPKLDLFIKLILIIGSIVAFIELLTIRARTATIAYVAIGGFSLFRYIRHSKNGYYKWAICLLCLGIIFFIYQTDEFKDYITNSFFQNKEDDVLSDRTGRSFEALDILKSSPLWGNIIESRHIAWVHNYPLRILSDYGIVGSAFLLILYFYLLSILLRRFWNADVSVFSNIGYVLLSISFFVSLAEPTFPYGPGTVNYLPFLLFGFALFNQETKQERIVRRI